MATDSFYLGSAPTHEDTAQVGREGYMTRARAECRAYIAQLRRMFGPEPEGCRLHVRQNPHDFGCYLSVDLTFDADDAAALDWAVAVEDGQPDFWDAEACRELGVASVQHEGEVADE